MMSLNSQNGETVLKTDKSETEALAGTIADVKVEIMKRMGLKQGYNPISHNREYLLEHAPKSADQLPPRSMQDSFTSACIPLSTDIALRDKYIGFLGRLRIGRLLEDMDLFAVWICHQHVLVKDLPPGIPLPYTFVTILVDKIDFADVEKRTDCDVRLSGHVSWVGSSSIEVVVWLEQKKEDKWLKLTRALFLMAARDPTNTRAAMVNPIVPRNEEEQKILAGGESRKKRRQNIKKLDLMKTEPNPLESRLIHEMFMKTIDTKSKAFNKRILPPGAVWMEEASMGDNLIFSHPEDRNNHNKIFGGFLMRHGLELGWALAYTFSKKVPKLINISDISFIHPVDVSSLISMTGHVLYTELNYMEIVVLAEILDPITGAFTTTNSFYYTFKVPDMLPQIVPKTYHETIWYLQGRRTFKQLMDERNNDGN